MVSYTYDEQCECFKRDDNRGRPLAVNVSEAQKIVSLMDLGYSMNEITGRVSLSDPKATVSTIRSFIRNYRNGNIKMPVDAPAPTRNFENFSNDIKIEELERRVSELEKKIQSSEPVQKISWIKRLGL